MFLLLAQLVAPPLQRGPARLPEPAPQQQPPSAQGHNRNDDLKLIPKNISPEQPNHLEARPSSTPSNSALPRINGDLPYSSSQLEALLRGCDADSDVKTSLKRCAELLNGQLQQDGYVNSRVYTETVATPGQLTVVMGRLVELHVDSDEPRLSQRVRKQLNNLIGRTLHLPTLQRQLRQLKQRSLVSTITGKIGKLGSDPTQAVLTINVTPPREAWKGDISVRNDGNTGSGEWRGLVVLQKPQLLGNGDVLQIYGEFNVDGDPELGATLGSLSYTFPLGEVSLSGSFGASRRNLVEARGPAHDLSFRHYQGLIQLQWTLAESGDQTWYALASLSANRNDSYLDGRSFPLIVGGGLDGDLTSGYLRLGLGHAGSNANLGWSVQIYGLQGIAGFSSPEELRDLAYYSIQPGESRALGGIASLGWRLDPKLQLNLRTAGQVAFNELTSDMGFTLGSDVGLRGLPGSLISGDTGWFSTSELIWSFWQRRDNALQLVPFWGVGGVQTTRASVSFDDVIGAGGVLVRWLHGENWSVELGWVDQFHTGNNDGIWNDWLLGSGAYGKVRYRF